jgi:hypothetical protein
MKATILDHIDKHLKSYNKGEQIPCPHPLCCLSLKNEFNLRAHLCDIHSIEEPHSYCVSRKRKIEDMGGKRLVEI